MSRVQEAYALLLCRLRFQHKNSLAKMPLRVWDWVSLP